MIAAAEPFEPIELEKRALVAMPGGWKMAQLQAEQPSKGQAIRDGWDATRTELEVLRSTRPRSPGIGSCDGGVNGAVLEAACLLTAKLDGVERLYPEPTLDLAARRFRGGIGLQELLLEAAWANGYTGRNFRDHRTVLRYAFGRGIEAAFSTVDIGGILSNVANKFLLDSFFSVERTWRNVCAVRNVSDFKTATSYRLIGKDQYELVAPGGEIKHGPHRGRDEVQAAFARPAQGRGRRCQGRAPVACLPVEGRAAGDFAARRPGVRRPPRHL